jgi:hypothetical protein
MERNFINTLIMECKKMLNIGTINLRYSQEYKKSGPSLNRFLA